MVESKRELNAQIRFQMDLLRLSAQTNAAEQASEPDRSKAEALEELVPVLRPARSNRGAKR